jgi:hypothetical protein
MKLTEAEINMLHALAGNLHGRVATALLKPAARAMAKRMRRKGLLSKKWRSYAALTQRGYDAVRIHQ